MGYVRFHSVFFKSLSGSERSGFSNSSAALSNAFVFFRFSAGTRQESAIQVLTPKAGRTKRCNTNQAAKIRMKTRLSSTSSPPLQSAADHTMFRREHNRIASRDRRREAAPSGKETRKAPFLSSNEASPRKFRTSQKKTPCPARKGVMKTFFFKEGRQSSSIPPEAMNSVRIFWASGPISVNSTPNPRRLPFSISRLQRNIASASMGPGVS